MERLQGAALSALKRLIVKPPLPRGVYLWGPVGRGKSFLMDSFYLCLPLVRKRRVHFHHFMREIHREMNLLKGTEDPIAEAAVRSAGRYRLVCFDEFHVSDIADAMILGRYLEQVMDRGVVFCMTSNYHPDALYPNGLQRERFLPAIELIKQRLDVIGVDNGTDYRRLKMERLQVYHIGTDSEFPAVFNTLKDVEEERHPLDVEGRSIPYRKRAGGLVWFDFRALCAGPRSYADYVDLAQRFHTVMLSGVPRMSSKNADAARRFTWLVDVLYDERVNLIVSAEAEPEQLFHGRREQRRVPAQRQPPERDAVGAIPADGASPGSGPLAPVRRKGRAILPGLLLVGLQQAQHRRPLEHAVGPPRAGLVEVRGLRQHLPRREDSLGAPAP